MLYQHVGIGPITKSKDLTSQIMSQQRLLQWINYPEWNAELTAQM